MSQHKKTYCHVCLEIHNGRSIIYFRGRFCKKICESSQNVLWRVAWFVFTSVIMLLNRNNKFTRLGTLRRYSTTGRLSLAVRKTQFLKFDGFALSNRTSLYLATARHFLFVIIELQLSVALLIQTELALCVNPL